MKFRKWYAQFYADGTVSGQDVWPPRRRPPASSRSSCVPPTPPRRAKYRQSE